MQRAGSAELRVGRFHAFAVETLDRCDECVRFAGLEPKRESTLAR
jgi:hypothetical protein